MTEMSDVQTTERFSPVTNHAWLVSWAGYWRKWRDTTDVSGGRHVLKLQGDWHLHMGIPAQPTERELIVSYLTDIWVGIIYVENQPRYDIYL